MKFGRLVIFIFPSTLITRLHTPKNEKKKGKDETLASEIYPPLGLIL